MVPPRPPPFSVIIVAYGQGNDKTDDVSILRHGQCPQGRSLTQRYFACDFRGRNSISAGSRCLLRTAHVVPYRNHVKRHFKSVSFQLICTCESKLNDYTNLQDSTLKNQVCVKSGYLGGQLKKICCSLVTYFALTCFDFYVKSQVISSLENSVINQQHALYSPQKMMKILLLK